MLLSFETLNPWLMEAGDDVPQGCYWTFVLLLRGASADRWLVQWMSWAAAPGQPEFHFPVGKSGCFFLICSQWVRNCLSLPCLDSQTPVVFWSLSSEERWSNLSTNHKINGQYIAVFWSFFPIFHLAWNPERWQFVKSKPGPPTVNQSFQNGFFILTL